MLMSRALDPSEPVAAPEPGTKPRAEAPVAVNSAVAFFREPLAPIFTAMAVLVLVVVCIQFARTAGLVAALWGAGGLAVAVWLRNARGPSYDLCFAGLLATGIVAGELLAGNSYLLSALFTVINMMEIAAAVLLARRFAPTLNLATVDGACRFLLSAAVIAPIPAAAAAAGALYLIEGADPLYSFQTWWFGHALGIAVLGAFGLSLTRRHLVMLRNPVKAAEAAVLLALLTAT
jgi:integral membrane sensor domain MASE1